MSGAMRRIGEYLGLLEDTGYDEYDDELVEERPTRDHAPVRQERAARPGRPAPVADLNERRRPAPVQSAPMVAELSRITTLTPRTYNEARAIGEEYREGTPVIMNLSEMDDADAKRLVDFAAGLIFATRGSIERVTNKVFLLSPPNVSVAAEDKQRIADAGFFNQS
ncbi:cell division protein SepF [Nocardioides panacisoli]|uniref:Cell division protein SepF n=1 Tax=Nocardioides panacisoli TaxID=627624 RepID=A0ABP7I8R7_9ACTN